MNWLTVIVHWLHVLFAVTWFGGHIARVLLVEPAVRTLPAESQAAFNRYIEKYGTRIFVPVIVGVGITGILRGTVFGPVKSLDVLFGREASGRDLCDPRSGGVARRQPCCLSMGCRQWRLNGRRFPFPSVASGGRPANGVAGWAGRSMGGRRLPPASSLVTMAW